MSRCLGCLKEINEETYCPSCLKALFDGNRKIRSILNFDKKDFLEARFELAEKISISGIQDKISLRLENNELIPTEKDGTYILKPIPINPTPRLTDDIPANEHLTMQIARQIFNIRTAENGLIRFSDEELAYITKRFDRTNNKKLRQEDFCQLSGKTPETAGMHFKYDGSYEEIGKMIFDFVAAPRIEIEKYFFQIVFSYVFGNGDVHLKNLSIIESPYSDFVLSPAYDMVNTTVHFPSESRMALDLFNDFETESFKINGFYKRIDFIKFGEKLSMKSGRIEKFIQYFFDKKNDSINIINRSFLSSEAKKKYIEIVKDRLKAIHD